MFNHCRAGIALLLLSVMISCATSRSQANRKPQLAGRDLVVPEGCVFTPEEGGGGQIDCNRMTLLQWYPILDPRTDAQVLGDLGSGYAKISQDGTFKDPEISCAVEGNDTKCKDYTFLQKENGAELRVLAGVTTVRYSRLLVICLHVPTPDKFLPAACQQSMGLKE